MKDAVAVAEAASVAVVAERFAAAQVDGAKRIDAFADLDPVSADVLHRCGADRTGNQRQVLESRPALVQRPGDEFVPVLAGAGANVPGVFILSDQLAATDRHVQHQAVVVAGEQQITAAAENEAARWQLAGESRQLRELVGSPDLGVERGAAGQRQRVARAKVGVALDEVG